MMKYNNVLIFVFVLGLAFFACKKEEAVVNPYDSVDYGTTDSSITDTLSKNELSSIHQDIFQPKCATPGCHDGTFEPDFRTAQSAFSSLVYHPVVKNNVDSSFKYRVIPSNSAGSVLYERLTNCCFVNTNDRMPQDNIGTPLPDDDITRIKAWIDGGAKDISGAVATEPNSEPAFQYVYVILDEGFPAVWQSEVLSVDSNRVDEIFYGAMTLDTNMSVVLVTEVTDDKTSVGDMKNGRLLISYDKDDFSAPIQTITSNFLNVDDGIWYNSFSTAGLQEDTQVFMRYYINDGDHPADTEFPTTTVPEYFKGHWSFIIKAGSNL